MEIDELPPKIGALLKGDHQAVSFYLRMAGLYLIVWEELKELVVSSVRDFLSDDFRISDGELVGTPGEEWLQRVKGVSQFKAGRNFLVEIGCISEVDNAFIDRFARYRGRVAHELFAILVDDRADPLDPEVLSEAIVLLKKIDNWWIVNVELAIAPDIDIEDIDIGAATGARIIILDQLIQAALVDAQAGTS